MPRLFLTLILLCAVAAHAADRPNIVLIMADDMGYECVGANGSTHYKTPNLDRLAASGIRFENCYSQPICTPSRVQIMTGRYNHRNYVRFGHLAPTEITFGNVLKQAGYATCIAGKWQLEGGFDGPTKFGFDEYCLWQLTRRPGRYPNPGLEINGKAVDFNHGEYGPDITSDFLIDFIKRHKDGPFFAYYPMILPHYPFEPTPDSTDWNPASKGELKGIGDKKYFRDMVAYVDKMVGKVDQALRDLGVRDNTLLIFTCDNGTYKGLASPFRDGEVVGGKGTLPNAGTHVPMIAHWPARMKSAVVNRDLIDFSDVLPTLAELTGAKLPADRPIDGVSFAPQLRGEKGEPRDWVFCWYDRNGARGENSTQQSARTQTYKLYHDGRFYDVPSDELEKHNLSPADLDPRAQKTREMLQAILDTMAGHKIEVTLPDLKSKKKKSKP